MRTNPSTTKIWATLATGALLFGGCATGSGSSQEAEDIEYGPDVTFSGQLKIMGFSSADEVAESRIELTKSELGDETEVSLVEGDLDIQQFLSAVAGGTPPDLIYAGRDQIGSLAARGAIISLDQCIAGEQIDMDQYIETAVDQVTLGEHVYGIPEFNTV